MFGKLRVLLWKETAYRLQFETIFLFIFPLAFAILINFHVDFIVGDNNPEKDLEIFEPNKIDEKCKIVENDDILAYEPSSPITKNIMELTVCLTGSNYSIKNFISFK